MVFATPPFALVKAIFLNRTPQLPLAAVSANYAIIQRFLGNSPGFREPGSIFHLPARSAAFWEGFDLAQPLLELISRPRVRERPGEVFDVLLVGPHEH